MRVFRLLFLLMITFSGCNQMQPEWKGILRELDKDQIEILDVFFRNLFENTGVGYTLFGEKPLSIESIASVQNFFPTSVKIYDKHQKNEYLTKLGFEILKSLPIKSPNYFFVESDDIVGGTKQLSIGNRQKLKSIIKENCPLFQYVLGPKFAAEDFFHEIEMKKKSIYSIFHTNRVLVGIVLGYGVRNALLESRFEYIEDQFFSVNFLPMKSAKAKFFTPIFLEQKKANDPQFFHHKIYLPSFSFTSLKDEKTWLKAEHKLSLKQSLKGSKASFPWFGFWDSKESQKLIESYQKTQKYLNEILESDRFLEIVFERIFGK